MIVKVRGYVKVIVSLQVCVVGADLLEKAGRGSLRVLELEVL